VELIFKIWKKLLYFLVTGSTSVFIAACYGMPANYPLRNPWLTWTIKVQDQGNQPIKGLEVTTVRFLKGTTVPDTFDIHATDSSGSCSTLVQPYDTSDGQRFLAFIKDTDGVQNGGQFADTIAQWNGTQETIVTMRIQQ
jgi:hypothetical protein